MGDAKRTLHISGLPVDFRTRELYLLYRPYAGFKAGFVKYGEGKLSLAFVEFDTEEHAEAAKEDTDMLAIDPAYPEQKIHVHIAATNMKKHSDTMIGSNAGSVSHLAGPYHLAGTKAPPPPCSTLYLSNLDPKLTEDALRGLLSQYEGFNKVTVKNGKAWADFCSVLRASSAMVSLNNWVPEAGMQPIGVSWAKTETKVK
eukprot:Sspe_Gene.6001::Locus_2012_Transcript_1_1_Confidence_1.000_Length_739::g.6001::m.6001